MNRGVILAETVGILVLIGIFVPWLLSFFVSPTTIIFSVGTIFFVVAFLVVYFLWAPNNLFFSFTKEGTAKYVVKGGAFNKCLMQWENHSFDYWQDEPENWNVIEGKSPFHLFGGLRYYGFWPLYDILVYKFRWVGVNEKGERNEKEEWLDYILLKYDVYLAEVFRAEDIDKLPLDVQLLLTIRIVNPYKAKYNIQRWLEAVLNLVQPFMRQYVARHSYAELLKTESQKSKAEAEGGKGVGGDMWQELKAAGEVGLYSYPVGQRGNFIEKFGVEISSFELRQIDPPKDYVKESLKKWLAERDKEATIVAAEAEKQATITKAEGEKKAVEEVYGAVAQYGENGFNLKIADKTQGKDIPALILIHKLTQTGQSGGQPTGQTPTQPGSQPTGGQPTLQQIIDDLQNLPADELQKIIDILQSLKK